MFEATLKLIGIEAVEDAPLILPKLHKDFSVLEKSASFALQQALEEDEDDAARLFQVTFSRILVDDPGNPFVIVEGITDVGETVPMVIFSGKRAVSALCGQKQKAYVYGVPQIYEGRIILDETELVDARQVGSVVPEYRGLHNRRDKELVRSLISHVLLGDNEHAQAFRVRCEKIFDEICREHGIAQHIIEDRFGCQYSMSDLIHLAHFPPSADTGKLALGVLDELNHLYAVVKVRSQTTPESGEAHASQVNFALIESSAGQLPYRLTHEQMQAVEDILDECAAPRRGQIVLSADVGMGKTSVFAVASHVLIRSGTGQKVAIMAPNSVLVRQIYNDLAAWFPDLRIQMVLGDTPYIDPAADIMIGTTALLTRAHRQKLRFSLVIVDEEQKMGARQREYLAEMSQNYMASTATLVPRTMQLAQLQSFRVCRLTYSHVTKDIETRIITNLEITTEVIGRIQDEIEQGNQALIIYPLAFKNERERKCDVDDEFLMKLVDEVSASKNGMEDLRLSAEEGFEFWNSVFPGRVGMIHGRLSEEEKQAVIDKMKSHELDLLVGTTVLEAGITIPDVTVVVVFNSEWYGLSSLHQIRGRAARKGGKGYFYLHTDNPKDRIKRRLHVLVHETDGYRIAEKDLELRGFGDLRRFAKDQSGDRMRGFLPNESISVTKMKRIIRLYDALADPEALDSLIHERRISDVVDFSVKSASANETPKAQATER